MMLKGKKRCLSLLLTGLLLAGASGCGSSTVQGTGKTNGTDESAQSVIEVGLDGQEFQGSFSPFFAEYIGDQAATELTQLRLLTSDRSGLPVLNGIDGETRAYNNTDYTYYGPANLNMEEQPDGSVYYDITLRDNLKFSDGESVTVDDLIFSLYVLCDPAYSGANRLSQLPIRGLRDYKLDHVMLSALIAQKGEDNTDFSQFTQEQQTVFWDAVNQGLVSFVEDLTRQFQALHDANLKETDERTVYTPAKIASAYEWGELPEDADYKALALAMGEAFQWDFAQMDAWFSNSMIPMTDLPERLGEAYGYAEQSVSSGESVSSISGIIKTGDYSLRIITDQMDSQTLYVLGSTYIAPLHYYGDTALYNGVDSFGFAKCDLQKIRDLKEQPLGAGPYCLESYQNGSISYSANTHYYLGAPAIDTLRLSASKGNSNITSFDLACLTSHASYSSDALEDGITMIAAPVLGDTAYSYIGLNPYTICVGNDPGSDASKNLRKGIAVLLAAGRQPALDVLIAEEEAEGLPVSGRTFCVIDYPVSNACWLVPGREGSAYQAAYTQDVNGNAIYSDDMTEDEYWAAARSAALGFFEAAGYTVQRGVLTTAPEGATLEYEIRLWDCDDDDPILRTAQMAAEQLEQIGMHLSVVNIDVDSNLPYPEPGMSDLWFSALDGTDMAGKFKEYNLAEEWYLTTDPACFLTPVFYCNTAQTDQAANAQSAVFQLDDAQLDQMLLEADSTLDLTQRKAAYEACVARIMDWGCMVPCYQDLANMTYQTNRVDETTLPDDMTGYYGWLQEIYKIALKE